MPSNLPIAIFETTDDRKIGIPVHWVTSVQVADSCDSHTFIEWAPTHQHISQGATLKYSIDFVVSKLHKVARENNDIISDTGAKCHRTKG